MKVEAENLRLGNFVFDNEDRSNNEWLEVVRVESMEYAEWNSGDEYNVYVQSDDTVGYYEIEPCGIPLTVEELLKFEVKEIVRSKRGVAKEFVANGVRFELSNSGNIYYKNSKFVLEYIHQLQNLYHSLRGKELKRKV